MASFEIDSLGGRCSMALEENKAVIRRYTEACNKQNLALLEELVSPDYCHSALQLRGRDELKKFETMLWKAFPDFHETNEDMIAEGDKVCYRIKMTGTHTGELCGFPHLLAKR
jgi:predicted ester cyclase